MASSSKIFSGFFSISSCFFRYLFYIFIVGTCSFGYNDPFFVISYFLANDMGSLRFLNQTGILAYIFHWKKIIGSLSTLA